MFATKEILNQIDEKARRLKEEILSLPDCEDFTGAVYYVSADGNDGNDGKSPESAWKTLAKVSSFDFCEGDTVRFRRGDVFRGCIKTRPGVKYCAFGNGEKPRLYGSEKNLADPALWEIYDSKKNIWKLREPILDCGTLVFGDDELHSRKLIPSYRNGKFVCRYDEEKDFIISDEMTRDLDIFCKYDEKTTVKPSKGEDFPIPALNWDSYGELYLRCDAGNPGEVFSSIEALARRHMFFVGSNPRVTIENLCLKYIGTHAISSGGHVVSLHVSGCEIGWVGGAIQHYAGTDPNYPEGRRGSVTRFGNGVEVYGGCDDYVVKNCYIYQIYDAAITHQITTNGKKFELKNIKYIGNLIEKCVYSIEYFLDENMGVDGSIVENCEIAENILRFSGFGWGQQRHNIHTPAHIKGWSYTNTARDFSIHNNIFDCAAYRMIHTVALEEDSCPRMYENTYLQNLSSPLGQYGANRESEPHNVVFDENADKTVAEYLKDRNAMVYIIK